jgi:carbonic anhydrase/acetyltransferase-like protein (isoleucine patch superfamily)
MPDMHNIASPSGLLYALDGVAPTIHPTAWVAPTAVLIGDVRVGPGANIWFNCVLRGDTNPVIIGARSNIQDGTVMHVDHDDHPAIVGDDVTVGHAAIIHACRIESRAFIGMGATVLDGAVVEEGGMLAARGFLGPRKRIGRHEMWMGSPAKFVRHMDEAERARWADTAPHYVALTERYRGELVAIG